jgi:hypothetical protein
MKRQSNCEFPMRANINFALDGAALRYAKMLNATVCDDGYDEIAFSGKQAVIPHITLLMGEINSREHFDSLSKILRAFSTALSPLTYTFSRPYLRCPSQHFIFVDTLPREDFRHLRIGLYDRVNEFIECEFHGGPDNVSHVTVGFAGDIYPNIPALCAIKPPNGGMAETIQICLAGKRGTCTTVLEKY